MAADQIGVVADTGSVGDYWVDLVKGESPIRIWDKLILGSVVFPGLAMVSPEVGLDTDVAKWPKKLATKTTPAEFLITLTDRGYSPGRIRAVLQVWTKDQWEDLRETLPQFSPRTGKKYNALDDDAKATKSPKAKGRDAFDIVHPATALLGIDSVIVTRVGLPQIVDQTLYVEMDFLQYFPNTGIRVVHSAGGSTNGGGLEAVPPNGAVGVK